MRTFRVYQPSQRKNQGTASVGSHASTSNHRRKTVAFFFYELGLLTSTWSSTIPTPDDPR